MDYNIIGAAVAAIAGVGVALVNYLLSKNVLIGSPQKYALTTVLRQVIQIGFLVAVYFIGAKTNLADVVYLIVGAVLGMTVPMIYFTKKLLKINEENIKNKTEERDETDG